MSLDRVKKRPPSSRPAMESCRELVRRILASESFTRSERLSSFLAYVSDLSLQGRASEINEQRIGEAVFGRPPGYDSTSDGIVRVQATRLRQRLDQYFAEAGKQEPLRISIPRGGYVPVFESWQPAEESFGTQKESQSVYTVAAELPSSKLPGMLRHMIVSAFLIILIGAICVLDLRATRIPAHAQTAKPYPFLDHIFIPSQQVTLVPGDSSLVIWEDLRHRNLDLADYLSGNYRTVMSAGEPSLNKMASELANRRYTSIVDLQIVQAMSSIAQSLGCEVHIRYARDLRPNNLKSGNLVLIGDREANPWVTIFEQRMNFYIYPDRSRHMLSVINRAPRGNELRGWNFRASDPQHRVYAVVAYQPNLSGNGNVLILEGTSMAGTQAAWDFVSDRSQILPFLRQIRVHGRTIPHFEVVLRSQNMSGSAVRAKVLAWRVDQ